MKVFLTPIALHSPAMVRIQNALTHHMPNGWQVVNQQEQADLCVFYPISYEWTHYLAQCLARDQPYALVQCCYRSSGGTFDMWWPWWEKAVVVWSYLDLFETKPTDRSLHGSIPFYHTPLGIDEPFLNPIVTHPKRDYIVTTGTVHGNGQEAILECWEAARECGLGIVHIGQFPNGIAGNYNVPHAEIVIGCTDQTLRGIYQNARWTCSLRYAEGFELPALESLSCGTRAVVFTQPATTKWYFGRADFVPESSGQELIDHLISKFSGPYEPLSQSTIDEVRTFFSWRVICERFWQIVQMEMSARGQDK